VAGLYELRRKRNELRLFGPEDEERAKEWPNKVHSKVDFWHLETTTFAASWLEAKRALGFSLTSVQTRLSEGKLTYFELFGRFWTPDDLKDINRGKKLLINPAEGHPPRGTADDLALLAALEASLGPIPDAEAPPWLCGDGPGEGEGDREPGREDCPQERPGPRVHLGGGEGGGEEEACEEDADE
jgi:hypothetical protein